MGMFVVWRSRRRQRWRQTRHSARLVESVRINGKPRQRFVAVLGSYESWDYPAANEGAAASRAAEPVWFWDRARRVLDRLGERITPEQRASIEKALAQRIAPPTFEQRLQVWEEGRKAIIGLMGFVSNGHQMLQNHLAAKPEAE